MSLWMAALMVAIVVGQALWERRKASRRRAEWHTIAAELGLRALEFDALGSPVTAVGQRAPRAEPGAAVPARLSNVLTAFWGTRVQLHGERHGHEVSFDALPARRYRTAVAARCTLPPALGLHVSGRQGPAIVPADRRTQVTTDAELERLAVIYAKDVGGATALLERPAVRHALSELLADDSTVVVSDDWVYVTPYRDRVRDVATARAALDAVTRMADRLDRAIAQG